MATEPDGAGGAMNVGLYKLNGHEVLPCVDVIEWGIWFEHADRVVAHTKSYMGNVSTVFLGIDHRFTGDGPPILFETMVFGGECDGETWRYSTWDEAVAGHAQALAAVKGEAVDGHQ